MAGFLGATWEKPISRSTAQILHNAGATLVGWHVVTTGGDLETISALFEVPNGAVEEPFLLFVAVAGLFGLCFGGTLWAQSRSADRAARKLQEATTVVSQKTTAVQIATQGLESATRSVEDKTERIEVIATNLTRVTGSVEGHTSAIQKQTEELAATSHTIKTLVDRMQTLPPPGFLWKYHAAVESLIQPWLRPEAVKIPNQASKDALVQAHMRLVLEIANAFDANRHNVRYACNLMRFRESSELEGSERTRLQKQLNFAEKNVDIGFLYGTLEFLPELSAAVQGKAFVCPDVELASVNLVLPVPALVTSEGHNEPVPPQDVLPGAPTAVLTRLPTYFRGAEDYERFRNNENFTKVVKDKWRDYFNNNGRSIRSFMSFPIADPTSLQEPRPIIGVLNLHQDVEDTAVGDKSGLLWPLMGPVLAALGALLKVYSAG